MNDFKDVIDACAGIVCAIVTVNVFLQFINLIFAIVAGACGIIWFGIRIYDRFYKNVDLKDIQ